MRNNENFWNRCYRQEDDYRDEYVLPCGDGQNNVFIQSMTSYIEIAFMVLYETKALQFEVNDSSATSKDLPAN